MSYARDESVAIKIMVGKKIIHNFLLIYLLVIGGNLNATTRCDPFSHLRSKPESKKPINDLDSTEYAFHNYDLDPLYLHVTSLLPGRVGRTQEVIQLMGLYLPYKWCSVEEVYSYKTLLSYADENNWKNKTESVSNSLKSLYRDLEKLVRSKDAGVYKQKNKNKNEYRNWPSLTEGLVVVSRLNRLKEYLVHPNENIKSKGWEEVWTLLTHTEKALRHRGWFVLVSTLGSADKAASEVAWQKFWELHNTWKEEEREDRLLEMLDHFSIINDEFRKNIAQELSKILGDENKTKRESASFILLTAITSHTENYRKGVKETVNEAIEKAGQIDAQYYGEFLVKALGIPESSQFAREKIERFLDDKSSQDKTLNSLMKVLEGNNIDLNARIIKIFATVDARILASKKEEIQSLARATKDPTVRYWMKVLEKRIWGSSIILIPEATLVPVTVEELFEHVGLPIGLFWDGQNKLLQTIPEEKTGKTVLMPAVRDPRIYHRETIHYRSIGSGPPPQEIAQGAFTIVGKGNGMPGWPAWGYNDSLGLNTQHFRGGENTFVVNHVIDALLAAKEEYEEVRKKDPLFQSEKFWRPYYVPIAKVKITSLPKPSSDGKEIALFPSQEVLDELKVPRDIQKQQITFFYGFYGVPYRLDEADSLTLFQRMQVAASYGFPEHDILDRAISSRVLIMFAGRLAESITLKHFYLRGTFISPVVGRGIVSALASHNTTLSANVLDWDSVIHGYPEKNNERGAHLIYQQMDYKNAQLRIEEFAQFLKVESQEAIDEFKRLSKRAHDQWQDDVEENFPEARFSEDGTLELTTQ